MCVKPGGESNLIIVSFECLQRGLPQRCRKNLLNTLFQLTQAEIVPPSFSSLVDTLDTIYSIFDRYLPRSSGTLFCLLFDQMEHEDEQETLDFVDLLIPTHFLHLSKQNQSLCISALLNVGSE